MSLTFPKRAQCCGGVAPTHENQLPFYGADMNQKQLAPQFYKGVHSALDRHFHARHEALAWNCMTAFNRAQQRVSMTLLSRHIYGSQHNIVIKKKIRVTILGDYFGEESKSSHIRQRVNFI